MRDKKIASTGVLFQIGPDLDPAPENDPDPDPDLTLGNGQDKSSNRRTYRTVPTVFVWSV